MAHAMFKLVVHVILDDLDLSIHQTSLSLHFSLHSVPSIFSSCEATININHGTNSRLLWARVDRGLAIISAGDEESPLAEADLLHAINRFSVQVKSR